LFALNQETKTMDTDGVARPSDSALSNTEDPTMRIQALVDQLKTSLDKVDDVVSPYLHWLVGL